MLILWIPFVLDLQWLKEEIKSLEDWKKAADFYAGDIDLLLDVRSVNPSRIGIPDFGICSRHKDKPTLREWAIKNGMIELLLPVDKQKGGKHGSVCVGRKEVSERELPGD